MQQPDQLLDTLGIVGGAIVLTHDYEQMLNNFIKYSNHLKAAAVYIQIYSSWIMQENLWAQAKDTYYRDYQTGDRYKTPAEAPEDVRKRLEYYEYRKFSTEGEFLSYLEKVVPGFSKSTWYARHRTVMHEVYLWCALNETDEIPEAVFAKIAENIVLNGRSHVDMLMNRALKFSHTKDGTIDVEVRQGAPLEALGVSRDSTPEDMKRDVARKVWDLAVEGHNEVKETGSPRAVVSRISRQVFGDPVVSAYAGEDGRIWLYLEPREIDEDGNWVVSTPERYHFKLFDENEEEILAEDWPPGVSEFIIRRIRVVF
jgi:hypothetical protein